MNVISHGRYNELLLLVFILCTLGKGENEASCSDGLCDKRDEVIPPEWEARMNAASERLKAKLAEEQRSRERALAQRSSTTQFGLNQDTQSWRGSSDEKHKHGSKINELLNADGRLPNMNNGHDKTAHAGQIRRDEGPNMWNDLVQETNKHLEEVRKHQREQPKSATTREVKFILPEGAREGQILNLKWRSESVQVPVPRGRRAGDKITMNVTIPVEGDAADMPWGAMWEGSLEEQLVRSANAGDLKAVMILLLQTFDMHHAQPMACRAVHLLVSQSKDNQRMLTVLGALEAVMRSLERHARSAKVQGECWHALSELIHDDVGNVVNATSRGAARLAVASLDLHYNANHVVQHALSSLSDLCITVKGIEAVRTAESASVVERIVRVMMHHSADRDVLFNGCALLVRLAQGHPASIQQLRSRDRWIDTVKGFHDSWLQQTAAPAGVDYCNLLVHMFS